MKQSELVQVAGAWEQVTINFGNDLGGGGGIVLLLFTLYFGNWQRYLLFSKKGVNRILLITDQFWYYLLLVNY